MKFRIYDFSMDGASKEVTQSLLCSYPILCTTIYVPGPIWYMYILLTYISLIVQTCNISQVHTISSADPTTMKAVILGLQ